MVSARVLKGHTACAYVGLYDDVVNAGANVVEADVVTDGNIITCSYYSEAGRFMRHVFAAVERRQRGETLDRPCIDRGERPSAN